MAVADGRPWRDDSVRIRLSPSEVQSLQALASGLTRDDPKLGRFLHRFGARGRFARFLATGVFVALSATLVIGMAMVTPVLAVALGAPACLLVAVPVGRIYDGPRAPRRRR